MVTVSAGDTAPTVGKAAVVEVGVGLRSVATAVTQCCDGRDHEEGIARSTLLDKLKMPLLGYRMRWSAAMVLGKCTAA